MLPDNFNVRVYGLCFNNNNHSLLISEETYNGAKIIKFPGGGLKYGEGTLDCLKREFIEEFNTEINILIHFYTTDFFQRSAFDPKDQILSIYYLIEIKKKIIKHPDYIKTHWIPIETLSTDIFTFPIDQKVASLLLESF